MAGEIERHIRVQNPEGQQSSRPGVARTWRTVPNCDKLTVLEYLTLVAPNDETGVEEKRFIFHVRFVEGIRKGSRVTFLGNPFTVLGVSDSKRLVGLELSCTPEISL